MSTHLENFLQKELTEGETITWKTQPNPSKYIKKALPIIVLAIPWTGFSIFWMASMAGFAFPDFNELWDFLPLIWLPFILAGILMFLSPIFMHSYALNTMYVITNKRAIILSKNFISPHIKVRSYEGKNLVNLEREEKPNGDGNLIFMYESLFKGGRTCKNRTAVGFFCVSDVKQVEEHLKQLVQVSEQPIT